MDAITLLKQQHKKVKDTLATILETKSPKRRAAMMTEVARELSAHMVIEESLFYPFVQKELGDDDLLAEAYEEHAIARVSLKRALASIETEAYEAKVTVLKELLEHHVKEEEGELFPDVRKGVEAAALKALGQEMEILFEATVKEGSAKASSKLAGGVSAS